MACVNICAKIANDIVTNCKIKTVAGIYQEIKLVNLCDIKENLADFTVNNGTDTVCAHSITAFAGDVANLNAVTATAIPNKELMTAGFTSNDTEYGYYFTHNIQLFGQGMTEATACNIKAFGQGAEVVAFVHKRNEGVDGSDAYWVYGWKNGLSLGEVTFSTVENNGNILIPLTTRENAQEPELPYRLFLGTVAATKVFFDSL